MTDPEERDRKSGLTRVLEAIAAVGLRIDATAAELAQVRDRLDRLERGGGPAPSVDLGPVLAAIDQLPAATAAPAAATELDLDALAAAVTDQLAPLLARGAEPAPTEPGGSPVAAGAAEVDGDELAELVRRSVASSHRAMTAQVTTALQELKLQLLAQQERFVEEVAARLAIVVAEQGLTGGAGDTDPDLLREVALDVEAIRRAIERAGGATR